MLFVTAFPCRNAQRLEAVAFSEHAVRSKLQDVYAAELARVRAAAWEQCEMDFAATFASPPPAAIAPSSFAHPGRVSASGSSASPLRNASRREVRRSREAASLHAVTDDSEFVDISGTPPPAAAHEYGDDAAGTTALQALALVDSH
uniref:Uncharacterized protein n=1 Tax=Neobodo designis TaxID=312471 RepID=A0A7S1QNK2_NEODS